MRMPQLLLELIPLLFEQLRARRRRRQSQNQRQRGRGALWGEEEADGVAEDRECDVEPQGTQRAELELVVRREIVGLKVRCCAAPLLSLPLVPASACALRRRCPRASACGR